ncbi:hypothetical protein D3C75_1141700 [compost metagenome]
MPLLERRSPTSPYLGNYKVVVLAGLDILIPTSTAHRLLRSASWKKGSYFSGSLKILKFKWKNGPNWATFLVQWRNELN